ncbi:ArnT family glycosyltransferase [Arcanobacterium canis]
MTNSDMTWTRREKVLCVFLCLIVIAAWSINLGANGYANNFYAAASWAGAQSWNALLWGAVDPAGFISVDKPPLALWLPAMMIKIFGLHPWAVIFPQVIMGGLTAALIFAMIRTALFDRDERVRLFCAGGGVVLFGLTPVAALMFRYNNPDALLALIMTASAAAAIKAIARRRIRWLAVSGALLGFGFLTKQLQVALIFPALYLTVALYFHGSWRRRCGGLVVHLLSFFATLGVWALPAALVSPQSRPYFGGSTKNSFLDLTLGYNGIARVSGSGQASGGIFDQIVERIVHLGRLFATTNALQWSYFGFLGLVIPVLAYVILVRQTSIDVSLSPMRRIEQYRANLTMPQRTAHSTIVLSYGWFITSFLLFSWMKGMFHSYYLVAMIPPMLISLCVSVGILIATWNRLSRGLTIVIALVAIVTLLWQLFLALTAKGWLVYGAVASTVGVVGAIIVFTTGIASRRGCRQLLGALCIISFLAIPLAATAQTNALPHKGSVPKAPGILRPAVKPGQDPCAPDFIRPGIVDLESSFHDIQRLTAASTSRWPIATVNSYCASLYELATQTPVMAIGGWDGVDPTPSLEAFMGYVRRGEVAYFIPRYPTPGNDDLEKASRRVTHGPAQDITTWVSQNFESLTLDGRVIFDLRKPRNS